MANHSPYALLFTNILHTYNLKITIGLDIAVSIGIGITKYVSFDRVVELWLKIEHIVCLALKAFSRIICDPPHEKFAPLP